MMYRNDWHTAHRKKTQGSAKRVTSLLLEHFQISSVLDVGCGHGDWLRAFLDHNITDLIGCDGPWTDLSELLIPVDSFRSVDLTQPLDLGRQFDLVISTDVAEHLPEGVATQLVKSIVTHTDLVVFGAAIPYQGGYRHINEQWPSWWAAHFSEHGFIPFDLIRPAIWNDESAHFWYKQNPLLYVRENRQDIINTARNATDKIASSTIRFDVVHPEKFLAIASYTEIAFKPFIKKFPGAVMRKIQSLLSGNKL